MGWLKPRHGYRMGKYKYMEKENKSMDIINISRESADREGVNRKTASREGAGRKNINRNGKKSGRLRKIMFGLLMPAVLLISGCGATPEAEETMQAGLQDESLQAGDSADDAAREGQDEAGKDSAEKAAGEAGVSGRNDAGKAAGEVDASGRDSAGKAADEADAAREDGIGKGSIEIDDKLKEELTAQMLEYQNMDTSVVGNSRTTKGCKFTLPEGFEEAEDMPGMYINEHYPVDASTIYYIEKDKDISLQLMTEDTFAENMRAELEQIYGSDVEIKLKTFESIKIDGFPSFKILCSYSGGDVAITQLEYIINADKSYVITYSQTDEYDKMEEFEASAETIRVEF